MKKINSIWFGGTIFKVAVNFAVTIPALFYIISLLFKETAWINIVIKISIAIGGVILLFLLLLIAFELRQDDKINNFHERRKNTKIQISHNNYECQNCGNQKLKAEDKFCPLCSIKYVE